MTRLLPYLPAPLVLLLALSPIASAQIYEKVFSFTEARAAAALASPGRLVQARSGALYGIGGGGANGYGTVFKVGANGTLSTLVEFSDNGATNKGATPISLVEGADGNFYGTTFFGGANRSSNNRGYGTVFRVTPGGVLTTLAELTQTGGANRGSGPACLVQGQDGNFYGAATGGGANFSGTLFRLTPSGSFTTLIDFTFNGATNRGTLPNSLVQGSDGFFYGTTQIGGGNDQGTLFRWMPGSPITTLHEFAGSDGEQPVAAVVETAGGVFFGTTNQGGAHGFGTVFKLTTTPTVSFTTVLHFTGSEPGLRGSRPTSPLVAGPDGALYGLASGGGLFGHGTFFRLTTAGVPATLVDFTGTEGDNLGSGPGGLFQGVDGFFHGVTGSGGSGGAGTIFRVTAQGDLTTEAQFIGGNRYGRQPHGGLTQHPDGNLYGTTRRGGDSDRGTIFKMTPGGEVTTLGHFAASGVLTGRGPATTMVCTSDGTLVGSTSGDDFTEASLFAVAADGTPTTIREPMAGVNGLALDAGGLIYGTSSDRASDSFSFPPPTGRIFRLTSLFAYEDVILFPGGGSHTGTIPLAGVTPDGGELWGTTSEGGTNGLGTVFSYAGGSFTTVADFTGTTGAGLGSKPLTRLLKAGAQTFYGATSRGGTNNFGTIFRVQRGSSGLTTVINFTGVGNVGAPQTFSNSSVLTLNDRAIASPYPSTINVPAGIDAIGRVRVTLNGFEHSYPADARFVLVSPTGQSCLLMAAAGGGSGVSGLSLTFADNASAPVPSPMASGTYRPSPNGFEKTHLTTDFMSQSQLPPFPPYGTEMSVFLGQAAVGAWSLYAVDTESPDSGRLAGGWTLEISPVAAGGTNLGSEPVGGLVQAPDGNFYGTTSKGGANHLGTVFKLTPGGVLTTLHEFKSYDAKDSGPYGDLTLAADGNIYGTAAGQSGGDGSIFRIVTQGAPSVSVLPVADLGSRQVLLRSTLNPRGGVTSATLEYGRTASASDGSIPLAANQTGYSTRQFGTILASLEPGTTYYYRVRASNALGTTTTAPVSQFTTLPEPLVTVTAPSDIGPMAAVFQGTVQAFGVETQVSFEWGTDGVSFPNTAEATPGTVAESTVVPVSAAVAGLVKGQTYHYRLVATNAAGTVTSIPQTFITLTEPVVVSLADPAEITIGGARVSGVVNARGALTTVAFEYGTDSVTFPNSALVNPGAIGSGDTTVSTTLSGLSPGTTYFYRLTAMSPGGSATPSAAKSFTTFSLPTVSGLNASNVGSSTATLGASVNPMGLSTDVVFEYGPSAASLPFSVAATPGTLTGTGSVAVSASIRGLPTESPVYFRVRAVSAAGVVSPSPLNFTTTPSARAVTGAGSATLEVATLSGTFNAFGQETAVSFAYGTNPGQLDQSVTAGGGTLSGISDAVLAGTILKPIPGTRYYFCARATNGGGTTLAQNTEFFDVPANALPVAVADVIFYAGQTTIDPLENDTDANNTPPVAANAGLKLDPELVVPPNASLGVASVENQLTISYNPAFNVRDEDSLTYRVVDPQGATADGQVRLIAFSKRAGLYGGIIAFGSGAGAREGQVAVQMSGSGLISTSFMAWPNAGEGVRESFVLKGEFDGRGRFRRTLNSPSGAVLTLTLQLAADLPQIQGTFEERVNGTSTTGLVIFTLTKNAGTGGLAESGLRTGFLSPPPEMAGAMTEGFVRMTIGKDQKRGARFAGRLPDGEPFLASAKAQGRTYEIARKLEQGGVFTGLVRAIDGSTAAGGMMGDLFWQKRASSRARFHRGGVETMLSFSGVAYPAVARGELPPLGLNSTSPNARLRLSGGDLNGTYRDLLLNILPGGVQIVGPDNLQVGAGLKTLNTNKMTIKLDAPQAKFTGKFLHPETGQSVTFEGAFRASFDAEPSQGRGIFRGPTVAGAARIEANSMP